MSARTRLLRALRLAGLAASGLAASLVMAELVVRLAWTAPAERSTPLASPDPALASLPELETVEELARPNMRGIHRGVLHRTNSRGVRGPEYSDTPAPGTVRIVVAGDSFTMGHRVQESETYVARLEAALSHAGGSPRYEVVNLGLSGLNARQVLLRLRPIGLAYHPHLVIYGYNPNDIDDAGYRETTRRRARHSSKRSTDSAALAGTCCGRSGRASSFCGTHSLRCPDPTSSS